MCGKYSRPYGLVDKISEYDIEAVVAVDSGRQMPIYYIDWTTQVGKDQPNSYFWVN
jgi:hypothetical protein